MGPVAAGFGDDGAAELSQQLRDGDGDQPEDAGVFVAGPLEGGGHSEEDIGEQADRGPAVPGGPGGDLAAVQPADLLGLLVVFLYFPSGDRDGYQLCQRDRARAPAQVIADGAGVAVPPEQQERVPVVLLAVGGVVGQDPDHGPVVVFGAFRGRAGAHPLPHGRFHQVRGGFNGQAAAGGQGHRVVGPDRQDVAGAACADALSQVTASVDFVAGDEPGADSLVVRVLQQVARELRFRLECDLVGNSGQFAALLVGGPAFRQVQGPADQGVPGRGRPGEGDRDLAHRGSADGAAVLVRCPGAAVRGLLVGGLVHDQYRVRSVLACGKTADGPACGGVQHPLLVAAGAGQQVLHPVRAGVPGRLGKRPAVAVLELGQ